MLLLRFFALLLICSFSVTATSEQKFPPIRWISEQYPPFNYRDQDGIAAGMSVEVVKHLWDAMDIDADARKIEFFPWARGYNITLREPGSVIFSTTYTPQRLDKFIFVGPLFPVRVAIITSAGHIAHISSISELNQYRLGVVREDIGEQLLLEKKFEESNIVTANSIEQLIKLLQIGRIDGIAYSEDVARWTMKKLGVDQSKFRTVYTLLDGQLGLAFNKTTDVGLISRVQYHLDVMTEKGVLRRIREDYLR